MIDCQKIVDKVFGFVLYTQTDKMTEMMAVGVVTQHTHTGPASASHQTRSSLYYHPLRHYALFLPPNFEAYEAQNTF
jgi:hypothetical protein